MSEQDKAPEELQEQIDISLDKTDIEAIKAVVFKPINGNEYGAERCMMVINHIVNLAFASGRTIGHQQAKDEITSLIANAGKTE